MTDCLKAMTVKELRFLLRKMPQHMRVQVLVNEKRIEPREIVCNLVTGYVEIEL